MFTRIKRALRAMLTVPSRAPAPLRSPLEPAASPVPWIADEVWTDWRYWAIDPLPANFPTIEHPQVASVRDEDRERAPRATVPRGAPVPPPGPLAEQVQRLAATPAASGVRAPIWPLCCDRLATLTNHQGDGVPLEVIEDEIGPLDGGFLVETLSSNSGGRTGPQLADAMKRGYHESLSELREHGVAEGLVIFQCRACGRVYVGGCHP